VQDEKAAFNIHSSHSLMAVHGQEAVYCSACGGWAAEGRPLRDDRLLAQPCRGFALRNSAAQKRLLECGIIPKKGAKLPPQMRKRLRT
jgi:hypothetical protein